MTTIGTVTFGAIRNVRKSGDEEGVYYADVEISPDEGFPFESSFYCARADDYAKTGKWVYQQIVNGNIEGEIIQYAVGIDPTTGQPWPIRDEAQPRTTGSQEL